MAGNLGSRSPHTIDGLLVQRGSVYTATLSGDLTLDTSYGKYLQLNANGSNRNVDFVAAMELDGAEYDIMNTSTGATNLVIRNSAGGTICTLNQNESALVVYNGSAWVHHGIRTIALS